MQDSIEKSIELKAPIARVWRALTDHKEFGEWFGVDLEGPFVVGKICRGQITHPGYEHLKWSATVLVMDHERLFSFTWCPFAEEPDVEGPDDPRTLVEFRLEATADGTRLDIVESGFDSLPDDQRRVDALRSNTEGWTALVDNIIAHVGS